ncbi:CFI-box-CTERM domain-containing protein [Kineothrix sp. MB12-C1]|uniref:CFI-box-CTERM domain-containing protein n=1 Tax=Kineothrix sp. MB12-C1 TaxID=3070215 RepID=UPI0027D2FD83|nr:CFI-box-CTERM domain-containing protein [Kineothrix sp. MB12-C1]WMC92462.1 CFI-box-CTERM domain-containing protein [Kineothrix sp. MB12-C1]
MNETLKNVAPLLENMEARLHGFKKDTYADFLNSYLEGNRNFFDELNQQLAVQEEEFLNEFSDYFVEYAASLLEQETNKIKRNNLQLNMNMFMAIYVMPAILEGKQEKSKELTDFICEKWAKRFKGSNIKSADAASIQSGFKTKLCYVTTAVCKSLNKPEDCYELNLLRDYRDNYLAATEGGEELVKKYYDIAPTIVKRIDKSDCPKEKYKYIWEQYLKPCIAYIENGQNELCGAKYIEMMEELQSQYLITAK